MVKSQRNTIWEQYNIMTKFFIIGNGFDIDHCMKTYYSDFRQFLIDNYLEGHYIPYSYCEVPHKILMSDGDEKYNENEVVESILRILDDTEGIDWNDVEASLGCLQYSTFLDDYGLYDSNDDNYIRNTYFRNQDLSSQLSSSLSQINGYFQEWIKTIKVATTPIKSFRKLINPQNDLFLNFNYTTTLQDLYGIQKVCHIHGTVNEKIYFGHGKIKCPYEEYEKNWFGAESSLESLHSHLRKNTAEAFKNHIDFFKELRYIANKFTLDIYSYGFSFSDVDEYYLRIICKLIDTKHICFYMNDFDNVLKREKFAKKLVACGFKGQVLSFHVEK